MSVLAAIRPDDWNFPLLVHVFGAMVLVGALITAVTALLLGWRRDARPYTRFGFWTLLVVALPAWFIMRIGAQWIYDKEGFDGSDEEPAWLGIGYVTADLGGLLLLLSIIFTGIGARRLRDPQRGSSVLARIGAALTVIILAAYILAVWAMSAKPD
jgi:hypothetical protein